ncbi:MAG: 1-aminocyclopropane-1-carboxylate deaminase [Arcobacteraceae bacterium]|nr:1-aminocyclopropane-1-carboxylate deaminase [Arcobacteraceae bacterium]
MKNIQNSPITKITFNGYNILIKRDDLLHEDFNGNKARKFHYFFDNEFPNITKVISYGSNQSNAMYSLSVLCKLKGWEYTYYTNHLPSFLKDSPTGNYKEALKNGMNLIIGDYDNSTFNINNSTLLINEGGAIQEASYGISILADEITQYIKENNLKDTKIFLPSGTGTTALFLQKYLDCEVLTCPCVGDEIYLEKQFLDLEVDKSLHPTILKTSKKFHFGKLYNENYKIWKELKEQINIEFDLLYDPIGWQTLLFYKDKYDLNNIIYIHQGGVKGNITMIERYKRKYD